MKIYVTHSSNFDYKEDLYKPLRHSELNELHEIFLPHEERAEPVNTRQVIKGSDLVLAEVSFSSTGQGIEIGWADAAGVPIICLYRTGSMVSSSLALVAKEMIGYENVADKLGEILDRI